MILLISLAIIVLIVFNLLVAYSLNRADVAGKNENNPVKISIVIAVKNEESNLDKLVESIRKLNYPPDFFEVIFIDDNSTDGTYSKLKFHEELFDNLFVKELKSTGHEGKREALTLGIQKAQHPYVLITDADCRPQAGWLQSYSEKFNLGYEMLFGIAPFFQNKTITNRAACFENLRNSLISFTLARIGIPYTAAARNFGFTNKAFESIRGYSNTKDTISGDDDLLIREAVKGNLKIGVVTEPESFVFSETKKTFAEYLQQRARHTQTSFHYLFTHKLILGLWHLINLAFLFSPLLMFVNLLLGLLLPVKLVSDIFVVKSTQNKFGYKFSFIQIFYLQMLYEILLIIHLFNARFKKIKWK